MAGLSLTGVSLAQSNNTQKSPNTAITRGELARQLEAVLQKCDADSQQYARKSDLNELRTLVLQLRQEMDSQATRVDALEEQTQQQKDRVDHTARPGF